MMTNKQLLRELRDARREPISAGLRDRVLAAVDSVPSAERSDLSSVGPRRFVSFRFAAAAITLAGVVTAGLWTVRQTEPDVSEIASATPHTQVTRPPGDDIVVFWLDEETPVMVSLADQR